MALDDTATSVIAPNAHLARITQAASRRALSLRGVMSKSARIRISKWKYLPIDADRTSMSEALAPLIAENKTD
jgi:hypothetical protein